MTPAQVIERFVEQLSWAKQCQKTEIDHQIYLQSRLCLHLPCHWRDYEEGRIKVISAARSLQLKPALLIWGTPDAVEVERLWRAALAQDILIQWFDAPARRTESRLMRQALDGIDWHRTFSRLMHEGKIARPFMEWDD